MCVCNVPVPFFFSRFRFIFCVRFLLFHSFPHLLFWSFVWLMTRYWQPPTTLNSLLGSLWTFSNKSALFALSVAYFSSLYMALPPPWFQKGCIYRFKCNKQTDGLQTFALIDALRCALQIVPLQCPRLPWNSEEPRVGGCGPGGRGGHWFQRCAGNFLGNAFFHMAWFFGSLVGWGLSPHVEVLIEPGQTRIYINSDAVPKVPFFFNMHKNGMAQGSERQDLWNGQDLVLV